MKRFTKFFSYRPAIFRGHNYSVNPKTMTVPEVVPTLKEIILSGTATQVGTPIYDESFEAGVRRFGIQSAPLEMVINGREERDAEEERSDDVQRESSAVADTAPSPTSGASGIGAEEKPTE